MKTIVQYKKVNQIIHIHKKNEKHAKKLESICLKHVYVIYR